MNTTTMSLTRRQALQRLGASPWVGALPGCGGGGAASSPLAATQSQSGSGSGRLRAASLGVGASFHGARPFPDDNAWNLDVRALPPDPNSDALIASIGLNTGLHPDFGAGLYEGQPIGIPYVVVSGQQARVPMVWTAYGDESDPGPYPVPPDAPIEGGPTSQGDRHVLVVDRDNDRLYELGAAYPQADGSWQAPLRCGVPCR
jgi:hypothetical protein